MELRNLTIVLITQITIGRSLRSNVYPCDVNDYIMMYTYIPFDLISTSILAFHLIVSYINSFLCQHSTQLQARDLNHYTQELFVRDARNHILHQQSKAHTYSSLWFHFRAAHRIDRTVDLKCEPRPKRARKQQMLIFSYTEKKSQAQMYAELAARDWFSLII